MASSGEGGDLVHEMKHLCSLLRLQCNHITDFHRHACPRALPGVWVRISLGPLGNSWPSLSSVRSLH